MVEDMFKLSMPDSNTLKASLSCCFDPVSEIKAAYFSNTWEHARGCPIQRHQFDIMPHHFLPHATIAPRLSKSPFCQANTYKSQQGLCLLKFCSCAPKCGS